LRNATGLSNEVVIGAYIAGQIYYGMSEEEAKQRIVFSLQTFEFTLDQLRRIEEILNE
jgi:hypothetical protein